MVSFLEYLVFLQRFFAQNNSNVLVESFFARFWPFEFFTQTDHFAKSIAFQDGRFSKWSHFSNIWCFMQRFSPQNNSNVLVEYFFARFWPFEFLTQTDHFAKSIAFRRWPIFKMVSFLEYLVFFQAVFCTEQLSRAFRIVSRTFLAVWNCDSNWPFCQVYSLCKMADFQNGLISRMLGVFSSGFLHRTTLKCFRIFFRRFFANWVLDPNWPFCKVYSLCKMADFQNGLISQIFGVSCSGFLHRTTLTCL